ncbi:MAG: hypothetical protein L0271_12430, partial [Gemmatimonadetes bacterium]|nr:hypothetical protein [Gemmatimonadota bacterium]
ALAPDYAAFSTQGLASDRTLLTWELSGHRPVTRHLRITGGVGHADLEDLFGTSYWYWSGGGELTWQHLSIGVSYIGADHTAGRLFGPQQVGNTWVATVAYRIR